MASETRLIAGAMSGTSADGVDVALVRISGRGVGMRMELVHHHHRPYSRELKQSIFSVRTANAASLSDIGRLALEISFAYSQAIIDALQQAQMKAAELAAVAAHGQTLYHQPPATIQWLDPALIAAKVGCPVISDFRRADCAAGGQGAPLVPFADYILFRHESRSRVLLNIGGIANITYLPGNCTLRDVIAFDTGPGNCISDHLCRTLDRDGLGYDRNGDLAAKGKASGDIWYRMREDPFFIEPAPKSTDGPRMISAFEKARPQSKKAASLKDLLAEACMITERSITDALSRVCKPLPDELIVSGGGTQNGTLMRRIHEATKETTRVRTTDELGVPSAAKEAIAFALLGAATLDGVPSNVPSATGARHEVVLGSLTPRPR